MAGTSLRKRGPPRVSDGDEGHEEECPGERGTEEDVDADMADAGSNEYDTDEGNDDTPGKDQHGLQERADDKDMVNNKDDDDRLDSIYVGEELAGHLATKMKQATEDKEVVKNTLVVDESEERGEEFGTVVENGCVNQEYISANLRTNTNYIIVRFRNSLIQVLIASS